MAINIDSINKGIIQGHKNMFHNTALPSSFINRLKTLLALLLPEKLYMRKSLILLLLITLPALHFAQRGKKVESKIPSDYCISDAELHLYRLINEYRLAAGLEIIPMSKSLSYVAHVHVRDLFENRPDFQSCNLHSWSDKGNWTPCCYAKDPNRTNCMWNKPREITNYMGNGQELILWENIPATPLSAFDQWRNYDLTNDMLLNQGRWSEKNWKALGVAIFEGYASIWFGEVADDKEPTIKCDGKTELHANWLIEEKAATQIPEVVSVPDIKTPTYYLIVGSFKDEEQANTDIKRLQKSGYSEAKVVAKDNNFRVSVFDFKDLAEAQQKRRQLMNVFKGIWIMEH